MLLVLLLFASTSHAVDPDEPKPPCTLQQNFQTNVKRMVMPAVDEWMPVMRHAETYPGPHSEECGAIIEEARAKAPLTCAQLGVGNAVDALYVAGQVIWPFRWAVWPLHWVATANVTRYGCVFRWCYRLDWAHSREASHQPYMDCWLATLMMRCAFFGQWNWMQREYPLEINL